MKRLLPLALAASVGCQDKPATSSKAASAKTAPEAVAAAKPTAIGDAPATKAVPVKDVMHGVEVSEQYRWLEDFSKPEVKTWSRAQNSYARAHLDTLPHRDTIAARVSAVMKATAESFYGVGPIKGGFLAMKRQPPKQQAFLVYLKSLDAPQSAQVVVDPNVLDEKGSTHIDWYVPSPDGKYVAISMSKGGTESGDVYFYEVATGKQAFEVIPRVNGGTAGGDLAWAPNGRGVFYTRYPRGKERSAEDMNFYQQLYFHKLGTDTAKDHYEMGKGLPRIAEIQLAMHNETGRLLVTVQKGDGGEFELYLKDNKGQYNKFSVFGDKALQATFGKNKDLYVLSRAGAPKGKVMHLPIANIDADPSKALSTATLVIPEGKDTIVEDFWGPPTVRVTDGRIYVLYQLGGPSEIRAFSHDGKPAKAPEVPAVSAISSMASMGGDDLLFSHTSFQSPPAYMTYDAKAHTTSVTKIATKAAIDGDGFNVVREFTKSKDGTSIPVNVITKQGFKKDGKAPCVVYGYGGYGVNMVPYYNTRNLLFAEQGIAYAVANIRGGGEFGEEWHRQGNLTNKQNVFDDFAAAVQYMVSSGYCAKDRVGILGGSNGGLLMGATMVQHPDMVQAVVSFVGIYDMLRVELSPNGAFNVTEFGTVKDKAQFEALLAYSPYHNVKDGTAYPPVLFITGENDPRVDPMQSRKMTARLQAANAAKNPVLLRTTADAGHGGGMALDERIAQYVDMYSFFFDKIGILPSK